MSERAPVAGSEPVRHGCNQPDEEVEMGTYRMLVTITGTRNGQDWPMRGEAIDLPDSEAAGYVAGGLMARTEVAEERATAPKPETATRKRAPRKKSTNG